MGHHLHLSLVVDEESMRPMDEHNAVSFLLLSHCRVGGRKGFQSVKTNVTYPRMFFGTRGRRKPRGNQQPKVHLENICWDGVGEMVGAASCSRHRCNETVEFRCLGWCELSHGRSAGILDSLNNLQTDQSHLWHLLGHRKDSVLSRCEFSLRCGHDDTVQSCCVGIGNVNCTWESVVCLVVSAVCCWFAIKAHLMLMSS